MDSQDSDNENNNTERWQTSQQRKLSYRKLLDNVEAIEEADVLDLDVAKTIGDVMKEANSIESQCNISKRYQHPDETLLDSLLLSSASNILVKCIESVDVNTSTYVPSEFANFIKTYCSQDEFESHDLVNLLREAEEIIPSTVQYNYVYGSYDLQALPTPKPPKERRKHEKEKYVRSEPEKVTNQDKEEKGIDEIVKTLFEVLNKCYETNGERPIKYYDYVIDTQSFPNTVENMFYASFLVRDGRACIDLDGAGEVFIKPMKKRQHKKFREEGGVNSQIISVITIPEWEMFKKEGFIQKYKRNNKNV